MLFIVALYSCREEKEDIVSPSLEVSAESVDFVSDSSSRTVTVSANIEWTFAVDEAGSSWCSVSAGGDVLRVSVTENTDKEQRETSVTVSAGSLSKRITVRQQGWGPSVFVSPGRFPNIPAIGAEIEIRVVANVAFSVTGVPSWMSVVEPPVGATPTATKESAFRYKVAANLSAVQRSATIVVRDTVAGGVCSDSVQLVQLGNTGSVPTGLKDDIKIAVSGGEASSPHTLWNERFDRSYDGSYSTMYHSSYSGKTFPITLTYNLTDADVLDYIVYYPRETGTNGLFREVEIAVKYNGSQEFTKIKDFDFKGSSSSVRVNFEPALEKVASVRFTVNSSVSDANTAFASCSEMEFYKKNPDNFDPLSLFSDRSCSNLRDGITREEIAACDNSLFRSMAEYMYDNVYPREFRVAEFSAYPDPVEDARINKTAKYSKYDNPTGIAVEAGDTLVVLADGIDNNHPVSIKIQDLDGEAAKATYFDRGASYSLANGINKIVTANKGLIYVMYFRTDYLTAPKLKLHFATGTVNGYFDIVKHATTAEWSRLLGAATHKYFDVVGKYTHLTFPTNAYKQYARTRGVELINLYDRLMHLEWEFMGLLPEPHGYGNTSTSSVFRNRMYFVVIYESYMNAIDYRTAYNATTMNTVCSVENLQNETGGTRDAVWGPAHEVGHMNQTRPGFKWHGMTEVTNNLHSIYVQTRIHNNFNPRVNTRLQMESMKREGGYVNRYEKAVNSFISTGHAHNLEEDYFNKLIPFWQLHLYLTEARGIKGKGDNSFYADIYQKIREDDGSSRTDGQNQLKFVELVCDKAKLNLENFFSIYGFFVPVRADIDDYGTKTFVVTQSDIDATLTNIRKHPEPVAAFQYITDENVEIFKNRSGVVAYELREGGMNGPIKRVYLNTEKPEKFNPESINVPSGQKLYSVNGNGDRAEFGN